MGKMPLFYFDLKALIRSARKIKRLEISALNPDQRRNLYDTSEEAQKGISEILEMRREEELGGKYKRLQSRFVKDFGSAPKIHAVEVGATHSLCGYPRGAWVETNSPITCKKCIAKLEKKAREK